eukprot:CAMPEP_0202883270 /NCGR_PEP_ID=MMETSP1391-20130828/39231_1 /ASSEMBLY_ACC=CAM_ASM_000867 /TAXON_ID=1034604 /ORGANISM="Chlamydomonas leiostraca, Strain SAG 11-49" /LENGTH=56 /DNA_ID=CAMNT_0049566263 /DNA_START=116 /DNA_END=282 /DNA_ORIENTATION=+
MLGGPRPSGAVAALYSAAGRSPWHSPLYTHSAACSGLARRWVFHALHTVCGVVPGA